MTDSHLRVSTLPLTEMLGMRVKGLTIANLYSSRMLTLNKNDRILTECNVMEWEWNSHQCFVQE